MLVSVICKVLIICYLTYLPVNSLQIISSDIDCKTQNCKQADIICSPNEDCFVRCDGKEACYGGLITCPINGDCNILCIGGDSCRGTIVNATFSSGNFNLKCLESTNQNICLGIKIYGSIISNNNNYDFNVSCNGKKTSCKESQIECPSHSNCFISCESSESCRFSKVTGPTNGDLTVNCDGEQSCFDATFNASKSSKLNIHGCTAYESCLDLTVYCPPNSNGHKNCLIQGNDNLGRYNSIGTKIYAVNGWSDVDIEYSGTFGPSHEGKMFCGEQYGVSCDIAVFDWSCNHDDDYCNFHENKVVNISTTALYTTTLHISDEDAEEEFDEDVHEYEEDLTSHLAKDRGITWYLEVRIVFGGGVLILIIIVAFCCYCMHKKKKKSFYHYNKQPIDTALNHETEENTAMNTISPDHEMEDDMALNTIFSPFTISTIIENNTKPNNAKTNKNMDTKSVSNDDILHLNPIQQEIVTVRQLLNLRKLMIEKPESRATASDFFDSDIGTVDTNDIIQRERFAMKAHESDTDNSEEKYPYQLQPPTLTQKKTASTSHHTYNNEEDFSYGHSRKSTSDLNDIHVELVLVNRYDRNKLNAVEKIAEFEDSETVSLTLNSKRQKRRRVTTSFNCKVNEYAAESESEIESDSETNDNKSVITNVSSNNIYVKAESEQSENENSSTETYDGCDVIPIAC